MVVDCGRAAYVAAKNVAEKIGNMTRAEILALDDMLEWRDEILKYWSYLTIEDIDKIIAIMRKSAEEE